MGYFGWKDMLLAADMDGGPRTALPLSPFSLLCCSQGACTLHTGSHIYMQKTVPFYILSEVDTASQTLPANLLPCSCNDLRFVSGCQCNWSRWH